MANKFVTFLETIGHDFKIGLVKLDPWVKEGIVLATAAETEVSALDPAIGVIFKTVVATVSSIEQKFTAMGQQTGTGVQKLAEATTILQPIIQQAFAAAGKPSDGATVSNYINAVVGFLNSIPASTTPAPPAPAPAA
jgi:hypothetical protein